jgi:hypothetical protein
MESHSSTGQPPDIAKLTYRFAVNDARIHTVVGIRENNAIRTTGEANGVVLYGPYISLPPGTYEALIRFDADAPCRGAAKMDVCSNSGRDVLAEQTVTAEEILARDMTAAIRFSSSQRLLNVEVRLSCDNGFAATLRSVEISGELPHPPPRLEISDLPPVPVANRIRGGRNPYDGYQRGVGLAGNLEEKITTDPDFHHARELAGDRTIVGNANLCNIFLLFKFYLPRLPSAHIVEFGSYRGGSAIFMSALARQFLPGTRVLAFDTFCGMPITDDAIDLHRTGDFDDVDLPELRRYVENIGLKNLEFVQGRFEDTAPEKLRKIGRVSFCHIDCDIRTAVECAYAVTKPYMIPGGYWVFDDPLQATCLGAMEAVEDLLIRRDGLNAEQVSPHLVFREPFEKIFPD